MEKIFERKPLFVITLALVGALYCLSLWGPSWIQPSQSPSLPAAAISQQEEPALPAPAAEPPRSHYIEITNGCGPYYDSGTCVNVRSGPGTEFAVVGRLRTGVVLKVEDGTVLGQERMWYKIVFDEELRYRERITGDWYVAVDPESVQPLENAGDELLQPDTPPTSKRIIVDLSQEMLYAYDGDTLFMQEPISTGLELTPTPRGTFSVYKKTPSRYMQGPIPEVSDQYYDLPGVPWNLYFTYGGAVIHGAYWHDHFGQPWSHGCVNLPPPKALELYMWADVGTQVTVRN